LASSYLYINPTGYNYYLGFRVASIAVPEPSALAILLAGAVSLFAWRRRRGLPSRWWSRR
jgi:hypothetical protein